METIKELEAIARDNNSVSHDYIKLYAPETYRLLTDAPDSNASIQEDLENTEKWLERVEEQQMWLCDTLNTIKAVVKHLDPRKPNKYLKEQLFDKLVEILNACNECQADT